MIRFGSLLSLSWGQRRFAFREGDIQQRSGWKILTQPGRPIWGEGPDQLVWDGLILFGRHALPRNGLQKFEVKPIGSCEVSFDVVTSKITHPCAQMECNKSLWQDKSEQQGHPHSCNLSLPGQHNYGAKYGLERIVAMQQCTFLSTGVLGGLVGDWDLDCFNWPLEASTAM